MTKSLLKVSLFICSLIALAAFTKKGPEHTEPQKPALSTIIIDAGHGGVDPGARGQNSTEAAIALSVSMKLGKAIEKAMPDVKVIYTRTTDVLAGGGTNVQQSLRYRASMANEARGDLFVSIHCNAAGLKPGGWYAKRVVGHKNKTILVGKGKKKKKKVVREPIYETYWVKNWQHGTETFIWAADRVGYKGDAINQKQEEGGEGGENVEDSANVLDLNSPEARIRAQLYEKKYFAKSLQLATMIEEEFVKSGRVSRGVKQRNEKGIWVLQATGMPSVLVETGFVTHTEEEQYIMSEKGQEEIVNSVLQSLIRYKALLEGKSHHPAEQQPDSSSSARETQQTGQQIPGANRK
ncbi:N-acetylmuramoyl-L-alanine amidase [Pseudoflavitalea sp. G-6-1-2]|uniref:N-acetylmuramoyl-L-alanine amidase family protein n=1 Tax=Pseudoflavitalea sp. G-6-1-2 TaxID=2728841 RepID=UPI00146D3E1E|nr:N-acetylmuramoyl-L-alanine amidase [Pseudoflavitalea sp. G-6-1-2]NML23798.1 N-acetylmuramoyl-L-alanine amidase [Pseudoflavitalea sp. G-6-1-2]